MGAEWEQNLLSNLVTMPNAVCVHEALRRRTYGIAYIIIVDSMMSQRRKLRMLQNYLMGEI